MRLGVFTSSFPQDQDDYSGVFILQFLQQLPRAVTHITVLTPHKNNSPRNESWGRIRIRRFTYWFPASAEKLLLPGGILYNLKYSLLAKVQLPFFIICAFFHALRYSKHLDIIHAHWILYGFIGSLISKIRGIPLVITLHGSDVAIMKSSCIFKFLGTISLKQASKVICVSSYLKKEIQPFIQDTNKVFVFPNGLGVAEKFMDAEKTTHDAPTLLWIGRFSDEKNVSLLLDIIERVLKKFSSAKLYLVGSGPQEEFLKKEVMKRSLDSHVIFTGKISPQNTYKYYAQSDVFVLPSHREGFGVVLIEAMATGVPVVASNVGAIPEIVDNNQTGFLAESNNAKDFAEKILLLLENEDLCKSFGNRGKEKVKNNYLWRDVSQNIHRHIYSDIWKAT
ncbi:glycosyltransferase [Patescibacteria group bacterium]